MPAGALVTVPVPLPAFVMVRVGFTTTVAVNVAVTAESEVSVMMHVPVPVQPLPVQPVNVEPASGVAVRVTDVPLAKLVAQVAPQLMPAGALVTDPVPVPAFVTVSARGISVNVAVTEVSAVKLTVQVPVPVQPPPDQPANDDPAAGVAVSVTAVEFANAVEHVAPQAMPAGTLETEPVPVPALTTVRLRNSSNVAVTVVSAVTVVTHVLVPVQPPPDQPVNTDPAVDAAVSVTVVPDRYRDVHVAPQAIPGGLLVTVPVPVPDLATVSALHCGDGFMVSEAAPAAPPAGVLVTPIGVAVVRAQSMTVVVWKQPSAGSECQRSSRRGGLPSAHGTLSPTLSDVASRVSAGWAVGSMVERSRIPLVPTISRVNSVAPLPASRTVTTSESNSTPAARFDSRTRTSDHVAAPTVPSQRWARRSTERRTVPALRLVHGDAPFTSIVNACPGSPSPTAQVPSDVAP